MRTDAARRHDGPVTAGAALSAGPPDVPGYEPGEWLGAGASGTVWSAVRQRDGLVVALKVLHGARAGAADSAAREVAVLGRVADEHLVRLHEAVELVTGETVLVLDHASGGSLRAAVEARGHLTPGETVTVLTPVASAVGRLHGVGVVHGDLSPGNVLLTRSGRPLVGDLGTSRLVGDPVEETRGTDGFVAPEVLAGAAPDAASDVYALGALGWFCLTGAVPGPAPWRGRLVDALLRDGACVAGDPERLDPRYAALAALVESCLAHVPADRPHADALAVAVFEAAPARPLPLLAPGDEVSALTHRIRAAAAAGPHPRRRLLPGPWRRPNRGPWRWARGAGTPPPPSTSIRPGPSGRGRHVARRRGSARRALTAAGSALILLTGVLAASAVLARREPAAARAAVAASMPSATKSAPVGPVAERLPAGEPVASAALVADPAAPRSDPAGLLAALVERRAAAWRVGRVGGLGDVDAPRSAALARDTALLAEVQRAGLRYRGLRYVVVTATPVRVAATTARLSARVDTTAYVIEGAGTELARPREAGERALVDLVWTSAGWRVREVSAAST